MVLVFGFNQFLLASTEVNRATAVGQISELNGVWSKCISEKKRKLAFEFIGNRILQGTTLNLNADCTSPYSVTIADFEYTIGKVVSSSKNIREINLAIKGIRSAPLSNAAAIGMNKAKICGHTDWKVGVFVEIMSLMTAKSDCGDVATPTTGKAYNIYQIEGDHLKFGKSTDSLDCSSPEKRPTEIRVEHFLTKVVPIGKH